MYRPRGVGKSELVKYLASHGDFAVVHSDARRRADELVDVLGVSSGVDARMIGEALSKLVAGNRCYERSVYR